MTNAKVAAFLRELAAVVELKGDSIFKVRVYRQAADIFEGLDEDVERLVAEGRLQSLPGVGVAIATKVAELVKTGRSSTLERYLAELPPGLIELASVPGLPLASANRIYRELGASSAADVVKAAREHRVAGIKRVPPGAEEAILRWNSKEK